MSNADFASRLLGIMAAQGIGRSALARKIWGDYIDKKTGRPVAKHRDRISVWTSGKSKPEPENMAKLAEALGVTVEKLTGPRMPQNVEREPSDLQITQAARHPDKVHFKLDRVIPADLAAQIFNLLHPKDRSG